MGMTNNKKAIEIGERVQRRLKSVLDGYNPPEVVREQIFMSAMDLLAAVHFFDKPEKLDIERAGTHRK